MERAAASSGEVSPRNPELMAPAILHRQRVPLVGRRLTRVKRELILLAQLRRDAREDSGQLALLLNDEVRGAGVARDLAQAAGLEAADAETHQRHQPLVLDDRIDRYARVARVVHDVV